MPVDQDTIAAAGMDPFTARLQALERQREPLQAQDEALAGQKAALSEEGTRLIQARGTALKPAREALSEKIANQPKATTQEEPIPQYERPTMKPQDMQEAFGLLLAGSMLVGVASRAPFDSAMAGMTGAMNGFVKQDHALVQESLQTFDEGLRTIKERNAQLHRKSEEAYKVWDRDFQAGKQQYELLASEFDDPIALNLAREGKVDAARNQISTRIRGIDSMIQRNEQARASFAQHQTDQQIRIALASQAHADRVAAREGIGAPGAGGIDPKTVDFYAAQSISGDNAWQVGLARGKVGQALIAAVKDRIPSMAAELGLTPQDVGTNKAKHVALSRALNDRQKFVAAAGQFVRNFEAQVAIVEKYTEPGAANLNKALNKWIQNGRVALKNDPGEVIELDVAIRGAAREHQRIVTGVTSNAQLHVAAQETADQLLSRDMTPAAIKRSLRVMKEEARNAITAGKGEVGSLETDLRNLGRAPGAPSAAAPSAAPKAAEPKPVNDKGWKLHVDAKGNKAYVGPNKEIEEVR